MMYTTFEQQNDSQLCVLPGSCKNWCLRSVFKLRADNNYKSLSCDLEASEEYKSKSRDVIVN